MGAIGAFAVNDQKSALHQPTALRCNIRKGQATTETVIILLMLGCCVFWAFGNFEKTVQTSLDNVTFKPDSNIPKSRTTHQDFKLKPSETPIWDTLTSSYFLSSLAFCSICILSYLAIAGQKRKPIYRTTSQFKKELLKHHEAITPAIFKKREKIIDKILSIMVRDSKINASDLMSSSPLIIEESVPYNTLQRVMKHNGIHHLLVGNPEKKEITGILSDRDLNKPGCKTAGDGMTTDPVTVTLNTSVDTIVSTLLGKRISCLPVVDGKQVVGVVSLSDLAVALQCSLIVLEDFYKTSANYCEVSKPK